MMVRMVENLLFTVLFNRFVSLLKGIPQEITLSDFLSFSLTTFRVSLSCFAFSAPREHPPDIQFAHFHILNMPQSLANLSKCYFTSRVEISRVNVEYCLCLGISFFYVFYVCSFFHPFCSWEIVKMIFIVVLYVDGRSCAAQDVGSFVLLHKFCIVK